MPFQPQAGIKLIAQDVLPGYHLVKGEKVNKLLPVGWHALFKGDTPILAHSGALLVNPCEGLDEDDLDAMPELPEGYEDYQAGCLELGKTLKSIGSELAALTYECEYQGYHAGEHGDLEWWLLNYLAKATRTQS